MTSVLGHIPKFLAHEQPIDLGTPLTSKLVDFKEFPSSPVLHLVVVVPSWLEGNGLSRKLARQQRASGRYVLTGDIAPTLTDDAWTTVDGFDAISRRFAAETAKVADAFEPQRITYIGNGVGSALLLYMLRQDNEIAMPKPTAVELICPTLDLAKAVWFGQRAQSSRSAGVQQGLHLTTLQELWRPLSPDQQIPNIAGLNFIVHAPRYGGGPTTVFAEKLRIHGNTAKVVGQRVIGGRVTT